MLAADNTKLASTNPNDITIGELLDALGGHKSLPLEFTYDGRTVKPGYHVTEVKAGKFAALDCGANPEAWTEIFVQLWDVDDSAQQMTAGKFSAIVQKVADHVALDQTAKLTFEVSDGVRPMQLHRAAHPSMLEDRIRVDLSPRAASCKPRDRWIEQSSPLAAACCGPSSAGKPGCG